MTDYGPYETAEEVRNLPSVRAVYDAMHASSRRGAGRDECEKLILDACERAGLTLGAYDSRIIRWLANWEPETCAVIAALIGPERRNTPAAAAEWGVRRGTRGNRREIAYPDEGRARADVAALRSELPKWNPVLVRRDAARPAGPWEEVPDA